MRNVKGQFVKGTHWRKPKDYWCYDWLYDQYVVKQKTAMQIAVEQGITENGILYWIKKLNIPTADMKTIRKRKHWGLCGSDNPMWNRNGELNPNWKGGITAERQSFYQGFAWRQCVTKVWTRDMATCQRCGLKREYGEGFIDNMPFHIHHIKSFKNKEHRADVNNLVLLCEACHHFVHSRKNIKREFINE